MSRAVIGERWALLCAPSFRTASNMKTRIAILVGQARVGFRGQQQREDSLVLLDDRKVQRRPLTIVLRINLHALYD